MQTLAVWFIGFSVFSAALIVLSHFRAGNYPGQLQSRLAGSVLLLVLAALQLAHYAYLQHASDVIHQPFYRVLLFAVAPLFYLYSRTLLQVQSVTQPLQFIHLLPSLLATWIPYPVALPLAFILGAGYLFWLARLVYALRAQRSYFRQELGLLAVVFVIALLVAGAGLSLSWLGETWFFRWYAIAIGGAFFLVSLVLSKTPQLAEQVSAAVSDTYAVSTLNQVDCAAALEKLQRLLQEEHVYQRANLDLAGLAQQLDLSAHQLSELINSRLGKNFPRLLREYRVEAAKKMLLAEPHASVLSVGLSVGFASQSGFYEAFRELSGMTPAKYRQLHATTTPQ